MMSCFVRLDANSNPMYTQRFDSAPDVEIIVPESTIYITDASGISDSDILDHWRMNTAGVLVDVGSNPGSSYTWSVSQQQWIPDLPRAKADKLKEINKTRDSKEFGGFSWNNFVFDSNIVSQTRLQSAIQLANISTDPNFSIDWTLKDNTVQTFTKQDLNDIGIALASHITELHRVSRELKAQLAAAQTIAEVNAISW